LLNLTSSKDILYRNFYGFLHFDFHSISKERLKRVIEKQEIVELLEQKMIRGDGEIIDIEVMAAPFYLEGKVLAQVIIQDITQRKMAERLLKDREKLVSIGEGIPLSKECSF